MDKPVRVLIIVENLPVPFDTRVWKQSLALTRNGYEVYVICPKGRGYRKTFEQIDGVNIYRHPMPPEGRGAAGYLLEYSAALFWEFLLSWWIFIRHGFRVIQGCNPPDTIFLVAAPFKLFGVKYIFDHHDVCPELYEAKFGGRGLMHKIQLWLERWTFRTSNVVMSTNETYRQIAINRGRLDPEDVFVVRNGPDINEFNLVPADHDLKKGKKFLVGYVGTMAAQEGLDLLLEVANIIKRRGRKDVYFICVGGGPELEELRSMCADMGLTDTVDFPGRVSDEDLLRILSTADVCVNPDKVNEMNDMSTMIKIMEYMALAKPIVQFDLKEGRYSAHEASLYAEDDVEDFAAKILWLLDNPEEREKMGAFGRERVRDSLAWQHSIPKLLAAYSRARTKVNTTERTPR
jgi:glycosyltransferase involved in cell wall biosynthesis